MNPHTLKFWLRSLPPWFYLLACPPFHALTPASESMGAVEVAEIPSFSHPGGVFSDPFTLELTVTSPNALIAYTLDGTIPGETSTPGSARVLIEDDFTNPAGLMPNEIEGFSPIPIGGEWQSNHAGHKGTPGADNDGVDLCDEQTAVQGQLWWSYP